MNTRTRFLATTRHRLCPICNDHTGDCRITIDGNILCHTNAYHDGVINNWQFLKTIEPAPWGFFVPVDQSVHQQRQLRKVIMVQKNQQELEQKRFALSASEFDREFRRLKQPTGLDKNHAQDLFRRGFIEKEIKIYGFFSIAPRQDAVISVKRGFPGISQGQFIVAKSGYTVPFFNSQGLIHGYQIRLDNLKDSRYRWAKGDFSSHIVKRNKLELPLTFIGNCKSNRVGLTEGGLKPLLAAKKLNLPFIGAASGNFRSSSIQFQELIKDFSEVIIFPDAGDVLNDHVMPRWLEQINYLNHLGKKVRIAWWGQVEKQDHDIDEITDFQLKTMVLISSEKWLKTV